MLAALSRRAFARPVYEKKSGIVRRAHLLQVKGPLHLFLDELQIHGAGDV
jgi:hypothetical protein